MALGTLAIQGGLALAKYGINRYRNRGGFDDTELAKRLKLIRSRGAITNEIRGNVIGNTARTAGNIAANEKAGLRGQMISQGLEGSIAGVRAQKDIGTAYMDEVVKTGRELDLKNAQSKIDAGNQYAELKTRFNENKKAVTAQNTADLVGGLAQAGMGYFQDRLAQKRYDEAMGLKKDQANQDYFLELQKQNMDFENNQSKNELLKNKFNEYKQTQETLRNLHDSQIKENEAQAEMYLGRNKTMETIAKTRATKSGKNSLTREDLILQKKIDNISDELNRASGKYDTNKGVYVGRDAARLNRLQNELDSLLYEQEALKTPSQMFNKTGNDFSF